MSILEIKVNFIRVSLKACTFFSDIICHNKIKILFLNLIYCIFFEIIGFCCKTYKDSFLFNFEGFEIG